MIVLRISLLYFLCLTEAYLNNGRLSISITRHHKGDIFTLQGEKYYKGLCAGLSSGTAGPTEMPDAQQHGQREEYECQCGQHLPVYRDDLNVCVDDIQECTLVPFVSGTTSRKIPYVFLPLKGQIVYPSAEIIVSEHGAPVCVVSGGQFLGQNGWYDLRNNSETEPPFRIFRDEGRTYLQWFGETSMRAAMEGRIILVHLMCKDASAAEEPKIFTPCIAFRVAGNPSVREVTFATDVHLAEGFSSSGLSMREYVAIGLCSLFLAVVYVVSIFLYLHWRKQKERKTNKKDGNDAQLTLGEEGVIKSNPLLQANRHLVVCGEDNVGYVTDSNSCCSDPEQISDLLCFDEETLTISQNMQTSAIVHPCHSTYGETMLNQDPNSIERLPEENVSIVETLEAKEAHAEAIKAICSSNGRRKLYFNPSYFEPELLKAPPPAALEFLIKIREVISIAKHKMSSKKFSPSLLGIPEEESSLKPETVSSVPNCFQTREATRENHGNKVAVEVDENVPTGDFHSASNEFYSPSAVKQRIIQKWLEGVPMMSRKSGTKEEKNQANNCSMITEGVAITKCPKNIWQANDASLRMMSPNLEESKSETVVPAKKRPSTKARAPPLPADEPAGKHASRLKDCHTKGDPSSRDLAFVPVEDVRVTPSDDPPNPPPFPPLAVTSETDMVRTGQKRKITSNHTKNLMDAVIQELSEFKRSEKSSLSMDVSPKKNQQPQGTLQEKSEESEPVVQNDTGDDKFNSTPDKERRCNTQAEISPTCVTDVTSRSNEKDATIPAPEKADGIVKQNVRRGDQDEHEYETILLNPIEPEPQSQGKNFGFNRMTSPEVFLKCERSEGYSLVSEVYVNDDYESSGSTSNGSTRNDKISYEVTNEKTSRLTIHVKDSSKVHKVDRESDNFEPDTLERKQGKIKTMQMVQDVNDKYYSNERFHDLDGSRKSKSDAENNENFTDSLERSTILLKTNGSFKRNSLEKDVNELFKNLNWARMENFGSLREIYEAKNRNHRRRTETTSLIETVNYSDDNDCISTLSWCEERKNKLLHRGIVLHIDEEVGGRRKPRFHNNKSRADQTINNCPFPSKSSKSNYCNRSRSTSPITVSRHASPPLRTTAPEVPASTVTSSVRSASPPVPTPRSLSVSPHNCQARSVTSSPIKTFEENRTCRSTTAVSPVGNATLTSTANNSVVRVYSQSECGTQCHPISSNFIPPKNFKVSSITSVVAPPRPPKLSIAQSPPLPPRNTKPPLPPKNTHRRHKSGGSKFATRPLPPLPCHTLAKDISSPIACYNDCETMSTISGASMDSLNSSEYESFYTIPYEEDDCSGKEGTGLVRNTIQNASLSSSLGNARVTTVSFGPNNSYVETKVAGNQQGTATTDGGRTLRSRNRALPHRPDDSGYLSTDSSESYCPGVVLASHIPVTLEKVEAQGGQNSETEESICDGASESGAESTATDSFFYGNFKKSETVKASKENTGAQSYSHYTLRLSDVEVNSDTERHCVPIMVRP
ncbi:hypothetical protein RUM43_005232 [Polyplax serrata]|uniref:Shavenoid isoform B-like N-terminal domain-containing protein n=1 Tax=Polyplax serrata TaxID=468196 RepID=A0AAN8XRD8_POLSC